VAAVDPTDPARYLRFAVSAWKYNSPNVRYLLQTLQTYIEHAVPEVNLEDDAAARLIIAQVARRLRVTRQLHVHQLLDEVERQGG